MPSYRPSDELVSSRLRDMVDAEGVRGVAERYGRTTQTVRRWMRGGTVRNPDEARSIARTSRRLGYSETVIQTRVDGRFSTEGAIIDTRAIQYVRAQRTRLQTRRRVAIEEATTPSSRAAARALPTDVDMDLARDLGRRRARLLESGISGDDRLYDENDMFLDSWDLWRAELEASYGQV